LAAVRVTLSGTEQALVKTRGVDTAFMQALGFTAQQGGWEKR
ncbi:aspartate 1-decarboxylase autocleavage activator PanM, partial [Escherichia coli]